MLSEVLKGHFQSSADELRHGMVVIAGVDGYRAAFTLSEIVNRNDQEEVLLIGSDNYESAGRFSLFPAGDFFSDRAIKAIMEIDMLLPKTGSPLAIVVHAAEMGLQTVNPSYFRNEGIYPPPPPTPPLPPLTPPPPPPNGLHRALII
ncbi:MAG: hypothetical protein U5L72_18330 [Bacteroidales bacterium]|nr:hypothetical protein [Bacteroidales bacterium]